MTRPAHYQPAPPNVTKHVEPMRRLIHSMFMDGYVNRDMVAAICDAAFDELLWIDDNFKSSS